MKIVPKLIRLIWLLAVLVMFGPLSPINASAFLRNQNLFAYDEQNQARLTYDGDSQSVYNYDAATVPVADEKEDRIVVASGFFAKFSEFLAAKTPLARLQGTFDDLAEQQLLPQFRALDPNLKAGYAGLLRTGTVGNPSKANLRPAD